MHRMDLVPSFLPKCELLTLLHPASFEIFTQPPHYTSDAVSQLTLNPKYFSDNINPYLPPFPLGKHWLETHSTLFVFVVRFRAQIVPHLPLQDHSKDSIITL